MPDSRATSVPRVTLFVDAQQSMYFNSYAFSGTLSLSKQGRISLDVRDIDYASLLAGERSRPYVELDITWSSGRSMRVFIDTHDRADLFFPIGLERAGLYFKRSYVADEVIRAGAPADRIVPFGAMFNVATAACKRLIFGAWIKRQGLGQLRAISVVRERIEYPGYTSLIAAPTRKRAHGVLLRSRLWDDAEVRGEDTAEAVNNERIRWISRLKNGLGSRFTGGFLPTSVAQRMCPELIDRSGGSRRAYLKDLRNSAISIYTRGLHGSTAWKLPESMAAGCAVVGEPLTHILPEPLEDGFHLVHVSTPEACVEACHRLLDNPDSLFAIQLNGRSYFDSYMHPAERMARVLARAASVAGEAGTTDAVGYAYSRYDSMLRRGETETRRE